MKYVHACDQIADEEDNDHFLWSIKNILKPKEVKNRTELK